MIPQPEQFPSLHALTVVAFALHIGGGFIALTAGTIALFAPKGGQTHRRAGNLFFIAMLVMATFAIYLGVVIPDRVNIFIGAFVTYLVATAWLTVRRKEGTIGLGERIGFVVALLLCAPFVILSVQLASGLPPLFKSTVPLEGPVLIALYGFTLVLLIAAVSDAKVIFSGGISGAPRIARHLWRMCVGLTLATGSAFTNGFARLLPGHYHVPVVFFLPQFVPLALLIVWLIRVRFTDWFARRLITTPG